MTSEKRPPAILSLTMPFYPISSSYDRRKLYPMENRALMERYVAALRREMQGAAPDYEEFEIQALHVGGGIAGHAADEALGELLRDLRGWFHFAEDAQILLNVHPGMVSTETLLACTRGKVNWLSVDYATADPFESEAMGRFLPPSAMDTTMMVLADAPLRLSFDVLVGLPGQSEGSLRSTLDKALAYGAGRVVLHKLELVPGTVFAERDSVQYRDSASPRKHLPDEQACEGLYQYAAGYLRQKVFRATAPGCYTLAGVASPYDELREQKCPQIGFGLGSVTRMDGIVAQNTLDMDTYLRYSAMPEKITASVRPAQE